MPTEATLWPLGPHTPGKHLVLQKYLKAWLPIIGMRGQRIVIIDGFAGPGRYEGGEDGSPVIALKTLRDHKARPRMQAAVHFLFIEQSPDRAAHLQREIEPLVRELGPKASASVLVGAFDETMGAALTLIEEQRKNLAPAFVMVDPFGVSDTPLSVIERILQNPKSEVYISFMWEFFNRFKNTAEFPPHLDELFGTPDWRQALAISNTRARANFIFKLYKRQLKAAGAKHVVHLELYDGNTLVYAIFFATKHATGCDKMKAAIWQIDQSSGIAFRSGASGAADLFAGDLTRLKHELRQTFGGEREVKVGEIAEWIRTDATDHHSGQMKAALRELEGENLLSADESTRKRPRTFPDGTVIRLASV